MSAPVFSRRGFTRFGSLRVQQTLGRCASGTTGQSGTFPGTGQSHIAYEPPLVGRTSTAFAQNKGLEAMQNEFAHSSFSEEVVAAERDILDPLSAPESGASVDVAPPNTGQTKGGPLDHMRQEDMATASRRAMGRDSGYLKGGSRSPIQGQGGSE